jgi:hypothetical protein
MIGEQVIEKSGSLLTKQAAIVGATYKNQGLASEKHFTP